MPPLYRVSQSFTLKRAHHSVAFRSYCSVDAIAVHAVILAVLLLMLYRSVSKYLIVRAVYVFCIILCVCVFICVGDNVSLSNCICAAIYIRLYI